jgi:hypothetical protein
MDGATAFADSEQLLAVPTSGQRMAYFWWTVWTAVSGEDINFQFRSNSFGSMVGLNQIVLLAINLSDDVTENTWKYAERASDDALTTSFLDGASVTLTPSVGAHDWLVLTNAQFSMSAATTSCISRIGRSGEAASSLPEARERRMHKPLLRIRCP